MRRLRGMTRAELLVASAITLLLGAAAAANLVGARIDANEASAVATLRHIFAAEVQFKAAVACDVDQDGTGEYGLIRELTGRLGVRTSANAATGGGILDPPVLADGFGTSDQGYEFPRSGYLFRLCLPGAGGAGVAEWPIGTLGANVDTVLSADVWCCYAWPA